MARLDAGVPSGPFIDPRTGDIATAWRAFLLSLYFRTGGGQGIGTDGWVIPLEAEQAARIAGDNLLGQEVINERLARIQGDMGVALRVEKEAEDRQNADANAVTKDQLCSLWAQCDLRFLPTADPGNGQPWVLDGYLVIGAVTTGRMALEDGSYLWTLESPSTSAYWVWG